MPTATAAALAGGTTLAAYLNAKFHLSKDANALWALKKGEREYAKAGMLLVSSFPMNQPF